MCCFVILIVLDSKRDVYKDVYNTPFLNPILLTIWTICAFQLLNPRRRSLAKQSSLKRWNMYVSKVIANSTSNTTRIEPVGEPYREVCLSPWKGNWRISKNRIDWRNVLLSEKNYFHEKELKENGTWHSLWPQKVTGSLEFSDLLYEPKGHGNLCGRFDVVYDPKR